MTHPNRVLAARDVQPKGQMNLRVLSAQLPGLQSVQQERDCLKNRSQMII